MFLSVAERIDREAQVRRRLYLLLLPLQLFALGLYLVIAFWCIISIILAVWVYSDAEKRGMEAALWLLIVLLTGIIGLIIYLIVRD